MNDLIIKYQPCFTSIQRTTKVCNCPIHNGDTMVQVVATSKSGKMLVVMEDKFGLHGCVGFFKSLEDVPAPIINPDDLEWMICEAIQ